MANTIKFEVLADVKQFEKGFGKISAISKKVGGTLTKFVTLPVLALGAAFIKTASDAEETANKFNVVFREIRDDASDWARSFGQSVGRSNLEMQKFSSTLGDVLKPLGFTTEEAFRLSKNMTELALDVASFNNRSDADVIRAFTSALTGERESLKTLGIVINETDVKQEAFRLGLAKVGQELSKTAKAQATVSLLYANTNDAQGDLLETQGTFANQLKSLRASITNLSVSMGELLLPAATDLVSSLKGLVNSINDMDESTKRLILTVAGFVAILGPALFLLGGLASGIGVLIKLVVAANASIIIIGSSIFSVTTALKVVTAVGAAAFVGWKLGELIRELTGVDEALQKILFDFDLFGAKANKAMEIEAEAANAAAVRRKQIWNETHQERLREIEIERQTELDASSNIADIKEQEELLKLENLKIFQEEVKSLSDTALQEIMDRDAKEIDASKSIDEQRTQILSDETTKRTKLRNLEKRTVQAAFTVMSNATRAFLGDTKAAAVILKILSLGRAIINTALGVTEALALGPIGIPIARAIGILGAIEVATIAATPLQVGSSNIPRDMPANIHRGEMVIPQTFSEAIRGGSLSLSGPGGVASGGINIDLSGSTINGITDELVEDIFTKASENIFNNTLAFRGAA